MALRRTHVEVAVGEVAAPAARDANFLGHFGGVVDQQHTQAALARLGCAQQARRPGAQDDDVKTHTTHATGATAKEDEASSARCATPTIRRTCWASAAGTGSSPTNTARV